ncbi:hypothetical protein [uncultured Massilia sp.]|uniref:hypothetical protein n=1 Tax=uncultured Massilia sp. TaxID=169973 RepID=UPI0025D1D498|nr:hypothetical protein [uncultured Massilia sp.]
MRRAPIPVSMLCAGLLAAVLGGCAARHGAMPAVPAPAGTTAITATTATTAPDAVQRIPFRTGVSSATVEKLAKQQGCTGGQGAGLVTEPGPVEVYRMLCDGGRVFMARCELRQCRRM